MFFNETIQTTMFEGYLVDKGLAESSIYTYSKAIEQYIRQATVFNTVESYNDFLIKVMARSEKRGTFYYSALKHYIIFKHGAAEGNTIINRLIKPQNRDPKTVRKYLSKEDRIKIINELGKINHRHQVIALIQMMTGARIGDILRLEHGSINIETTDGKDRLRLDIIGKGQKKKSTYIINEAVMSLVLNYITGNDPNNNDKKVKNFFLLDETETYYFLEPITYNCQHTKHSRMLNSADLYRKNLKQALRNAGLDDKHFSSHDWRRCFSRDNYNEFKDIVILKNVLGHSDIRTTERYLRHSGQNTLDILEKMQN